MMKLKKSQKWIRFTKGAPRYGMKTFTFFVLSAENDSLLGTVRWYSHWRRYAFFPDPKTVFEQDCLRDIADFCAERTREHRARSKDRAA
jgi:hypothetical protein